MPFIILYPARNSLEERSTNKGFLRQTKTENPLQADLYYKKC